LKRVVVVSAEEVEVKPFLFADFTQGETVSPSEKKVTKKELKRLAKKIGLSYSDEEIASIKKLIEAYMAKR
jgi:hypothetical protein